MRPRVVPGQPLPCLALSALHAQPQQVIQPAAVYPGDHDLGPVQQCRQIQRGIALHFPEVSASPAIGLQRQSNLYVQMLGKKTAHRLLAILHSLLQLSSQERRIHRRTQIRVRDVEVLGVALLLGLYHRLRELIDHRQESVVLDPSIPHSAGISQLLREHPSRRRVRLRRQVYDASFRP